MNNFKEKYIKYKLKNLQIGGNLMPKFDNGNGDENVKRHLALFEIVVYDGFNKRNYDIVKKIYDENFVMIMANGFTSTGLSQYLKGRQLMFDLAPDFQVISHGVQFGSGEWIAVTEVCTGTFTGITKDRHGNIISPTNRKFKFETCSLLRWKDNKIIEERFFSDEHNFKKQIGIPDIDIFTD